MANRELHNWLFVAAGLLLVVLSDFIPIPKDPFVSRYLFHTFVDAAIFGAIISFIYHRGKAFLLYIKIFLVLQFCYISVHFAGLCTESAYVITDQEIYALINDGYSPVLKAILGLQITVLGAGWYGIRRGRRNRVRRGYNPAVSYSDRYLASKNLERHESGLY